MGWLEEDISKQYTDVGFPKDMADKMAAGVVKKVVRNITVKHRDLNPIMIWKGEINLINTDIDFNIV